MEKLIEFFKANRGKQVRLAEHLGLQPSTVSQWKSVPPEHLLAVEAFTGISRHELRPDLSSMFKSKSSKAKQPEAV